MEPTRVLLVEDDTLVRRAIQRVLSIDHEVVAVGNGRDALDAVRSNNFGAIVSDIDLPGISGVELLKAVRRVDSEIPVVLITGYATVETAQDAVNYGAFRYLSKPVDAAALRDVVGRAARLHALTRLHRGGQEAPEPSPEVRAREEEAKRLDNALTTMWMAFQPIVSWSQKRIVGYEALLRTDEPTLMRPPDLLDAAERHGRILELSRRVRHLVADAIPRIPSDVSVFINLHARDLEDPELHDPASPLSKHSKRVVLEITERASVHNVANLTQTVASLREQGFRLAIDDLGAGYAGLTSVTHLEPEVVKLDMSLVRGVDTSHTKRQLIGSIARVSLELGMMAVVEGVETPAERDALIELGCDIFQGYLFGRPARDIAPAKF